MKNVYHFFIHFKFNNNYLLSKKNKNNKLYYNYKKIKKNILYIIKYIQQ